MEAEKLSIGGGQPLRGSATLFEERGSTVVGLPLSSFHPPPFLIALPSTPMSDEQSVELTNEERAIYARRRWLRRGQPEVAAEIARHLVVGDEVPEHLLDPEGNPSAKDSPARSGKGSSVKEWREFAAQHTDIDRDVLESMNRDDIIEVLEARNLIESEA